MTDFARSHSDATAERVTNVIAHLDGALDSSMLDAMQATWAMLEHVSVDSGSHARAVRERLFWQSLAPLGALPAQEHPGELLDDGFGAGDLAA